MGRRDGKLSRRERRENPASFGLCFRSTLPRLRLGCPPLATYSRPVAVAVAPKMCPVDDSLNSIFRCMPLQRPGGCIGIGGE